jgi:hypothetical protein
LGNDWSAQAHLDADRGGGGLRGDLGHGDLDGATGGAVVIDPDWRPNETMEEQFDRKSRDPLAWRCPACEAPPNEPCTAPTVSGRARVSWFHSSRKDLADGWT